MGLDSIRVSSFRVPANGGNGQLDMRERAVRSLYPALHRMELAGWIVGRWGTTDSNRRARIYRLTRSGQRQLERETERWHAIAGGVAAVLEEG